MFPLKAFYWGQSGARDNFSLQISNIANEAYRSLGEKPVIIGECGIPMDMQYVSSLACEAAAQGPRLHCSKGQSFKTDNWKWQLRMMDAMLTAMERSLVGFT